MYKDKSIKYLKEAKILRKKGQNNKAIKKYNKALQQNINSIPALHQLALVYENQKKFKKAIYYYQQVVKQQPKNSNVYARLARAMNSQGDIDGAILAFQKAIQLKVNQPSWVYAGLVNVLYHNGEKERAFEAYQKGKKIHPKIKNVEQKKVTVGKEKWLFLDNDSNQVNQQLNGNITFSDEDLIQWKELLEYRKQKLCEQGISYFFLIAPSKGCVYPEYLPDSINISDKRCVIQLLNYLASYSELKPIYPLVDLISAKSKRPVYSQRETHWNDFGAFIGYRALLSEISKTHNVDILSESSIDFIPYIFHGCDLGKKLGIKSDLSIRSKILESNFECTFHNHVKNKGKLIIYENKNKELPKAIVFRDSFSSQLIKFLASSFSRLVVVWQPNIDYSIVQNENPNIVISQQAERFLVKIPADLGGLTNQEIVHSKLKKVKV